MGLSANFVRFAAPVEALDRAVLFPGNAALKLTTNGEGAGLTQAGPYWGFAVCIALASDTPRGIIWDGGRDRGLDVAFHPNPVANGNPAICCGITDVTNSYAARFECDPRSLVGTLTYRSLEFEYIFNEGFRIWLDGVEIPATATGGVHNQGGSNASHTGIGASINQSPMRTTITASQGAVIGSTAVWTSGGSASAPVEFMKGGVAWVMIERSPGTPRCDVRFNGAFYDEVNPGLTTSPNNVTNGFDWLPTTQTEAFAWTRSILSLTGPLGQSTAEPLVLSIEQGPGTVPFSLVVLNDAWQSVPLAELTVGIVGAGVSVTGWVDDKGAPLDPLSASIPARGHARVMLAVARTAGFRQVVVTVDGESAGAPVATLDIDGGIGSERGGGGRARSRSRGRNRRRGGRGKR
jgi:hypothetical protein